MAPARRSLLAALPLAGALSLAVAASPAAAADAPAAQLAGADQACLGCHAQEGMAKTFAKGESLSLRVEAEAFARSVHGSLGCAACHSDVDLKSHPGAGRNLESARAFSIAQAGACRQCHEDAFQQHQGSIHAARVKEGNAVAPVCTGCHGIHSITPKTAYQTCVTCHAADLDAHRQWLPNATLHHEVVSCAACHAPAALRMLDLRLYDRTTKAWVAEKPSEPWFEKLARSVDAGGNGFDATELDALLKRVNPAGTPAPRTLRGRIELRTNVEAHRLAEKSKAIRACDSCHRDGAEPFQIVTVSVTGPDGRPVRHAAQKQVLGSALAVASLPEFYAIGGTRSRVLDLLFIVAALGGAAFPLGHMAMRWIFRKSRKGGGAA